MNPDVETTPSPGEGTAPHPARRRRRWRRWVARLAVYSVGIPLLALASLLAYRNLTALPTPETVEELLPPDVLFYARLKNAAGQVAALRTLHYMRNSAWLDEAGRARSDLPGPMPWDDDETLEDEHKRIRGVRQYLYFGEQFLPADIVAVLLPSTPDTEIWLLATRVEGALAESLATAVEGMLWLSRESRRAEHRSVLWKVFVDHGDSRGSIQLLRLGEMMVLIFGTADPAVAHPLIERYFGARRGGDLAGRLRAARDRLKLDASGPPSGTGAREAILTLFADGAALADFGVARAEYLLRQNEPDDARARLDWLETFSPFAESVFVVEHVPGAVELRGAGDPAAGDNRPGYAALRGHAPDGGARARGALDRFAELRDGQDAAGWFYAQGDGNVARSLRWFFVKYLGEAPPPDADRGTSKDRERREQRARLDRFLRGGETLPSFGEAACLVLTPPTLEESTLTWRILGATTCGTAHSGGAWRAFDGGRARPEAPPPGTKLPAATARRLPAYGEDDGKENDGETRDAFFYSVEAEGAFFEWWPTRAPAPDAARATFAPPRPADLLAPPDSPAAPQWQLFLDGGALAPLDSVAAARALCDNPPDPADFRRVRRYLALLRDIRLLRAAAWYDAGVARFHARLDGHAAPAAGSAPAATSAP